MKHLVSIFIKLVVLLFFLIIPFAYNPSPVQAACMCACSDGHEYLIQNYDSCDEYCMLRGPGITMLSCDAVTGTTPITPKTSGPVSLPDPLKGASPQTLIGRVIKAILGITGSLALIMFIYGGLTWMTAAGSAEKVSKGRDIIVWAVLGLVIIFSAYALVKFVFTSLGV